MDIIKGKDGVVRSAQVKSTGGKVYTRPVVKLIVLTIEKEGDGSSVRVTNRAGDVDDSRRVVDQQAGDNHLGVK